MPQSPIVDDDHLKAQLEVLRGRPLEDLELEKDHWVERSDTAKLCRNPVVSVHMVTYNHERFIRQALDSVMMQQCDFPFELVIGEDCSTDKTREICFEYQARYPEKIRVLYAKENSFKRHHSQIINVWRVTKSCRGEFCAWLEGDDYWIDPHKLQKQVDYMRTHNNVGLLCAGVVVDWGERQEICSALATIPNGQMTALQLWDVHMHRRPLSCYTPSWMWRREPYLAALKRFRLNTWNLLVADGPLLTMMTFLEGDLHALPDIVGAYRINPNSLSHGGTPGFDTGTDTQVAFAYFAAVLLRIPPNRYPLLHRLWRYCLLDLARGAVSRGGYQLLLQPWRHLLYNPLNWIYFPLAHLGCHNTRISNLVREGFARIIREQFRRRILRQ